MGRRTLVFFMLVLYLAGCSNAASNAKTNSNAVSFSGFEPDAAVDCTNPPAITGGTLSEAQLATFKTTFTVVYNTKTLPEIVNLEKTFHDEYSQAACKVDIDIDKVSGTYPAHFKSTYTVIYNVRNLPAIVELEEHFKLTYSDACSVKFDLEKVADGSLLNLVAWTNSWSTLCITNIYSSAATNWAIEALYCSQSNITLHVTPQTKVQIIADQ